MKILVAGAAGFIGSRLMHVLAKRGDCVVGIDNINDYYDVRLKYGRLAECGFTDRAALESGKEQQSALFENCHFIRMDIADKEQLDHLFSSECFDKVVNLAAQAGCVIQSRTPMPTSSPILLDSSIFSRHVANME